MRAFAPRFTITNAITMALTAIERARGFLEQHGLNERQALVVEVLLGLDSPDIEDFQAALPGVPRRTLQRDLQVLVAKRIAVAEGAARALRYRLQDNVLR